MHFFTKINFKATFRKALTLSFFCCMALILFSANYTADIFKEIENAFSQGNSKLVEGYLNSSIELETPTSKGIYSRNQAQIIIAKFFQKYPPRSFSLGPPGYASGGLKWARGEYTSNSEQTFRVTFTVKKIDAVYLIQVIKIE